LESYKTFIKSNLTLLFGHVLIYAQGIILMPLIIKTAGVTVYGGYLLLTTLLGFIYGISSFGVGFKCSRFLPATEGKVARKLLFYPPSSFQFVSLTILSLAFILFYSLFDSIFLKGEIAFSKWLVFPYLYFMFLHGQTASYFISTHRISYFNYATVAFPYINIALIVLFYLVTNKLSVDILFSTQAFSYMLIAIPLTIKMIREIGFKFSLPNVRSLLDDMRLGLPLRMNFIMDVILAGSDRYIITFLMTVAAVGYYNPGYALGSLIVFFPKVAGVVLPPLLSKAIDTGKESEAHTMLNYTIKAFLLIAIPFIVGAAVLSSQLLNLFANAEVSQKAYVVTPVIALATLFLGLNIILSNVLWVRMKTSVMFKINILVAVLSLVLNFILLFIFKNILAAAFTAFISYLINFILIRKVVISDWPLKFEFGMIMKSIGASILMGITLYLISSLLGMDSYRIPFILGEILIGTVIYTLILLVMGTFSNKELLYLRKAFTQ
jgi:O-antigen/teichoic acid export membrane protein